MSEQALDLGRSMQIVRRHKIIVGLFAVLGLLAGAGYAALGSPMLTSEALVLLPPSASVSIGTQLVIAESNPVLAGALRRMNAPVSLATLSSRVQIKGPTPRIISISAQGRTAAQAEDTANAVANSYIAYLSSASLPGAPVQARVLERATNATGESLERRLLVTGGLGALVGILIGAIVALAIDRGDRRLRARDEIAGAIGVPVLASIPVVHPSDAAGWTKLLENYKPRATDAWNLRKTLHHLGLTDIRGVKEPSLAVLSLSSDPGALALGPQLAVFAASLGIPTALVIGPQQDANTAATLRAACAVPPQAQSRRSSHLPVSVGVIDHGTVDELPRAMLAVVVSVVDAQNPRVADTMRTTVTVLGVSAGAVTADQLARAAASAAAADRQIAGIVVVDPDSTDHTTGRSPQLAPPTHRRVPTRLTSTTTETRW
jgi:capsular polysaccharide biosynthesis protein